MEMIKIEHLVCRSLHELMNGLDKEINEPIGIETKLFGPKGVLKSIELVALIVDLEEKIAEEYGHFLILADERAMSQKKSPFRSVSSLAQYICMLMDEMK